MTQIVTFTSVFEIIYQLTFLVHLFQKLGPHYFDLKQKATSKLFNFYLSFFRSEISPIPFNNSHYLIAG